MKNISQYDVRYLSRFRVYICLFFLLLVQENLKAASFDCLKAKSKVEKIICNNLELSKLDDQLTIAYKKALVNHPLPDYVKARQKNWINSNQFCESANFLVCIKKNYTQRIDYLENIKKLVVYSNSKKFSYYAGDAVIEYKIVSGVWKVSVWGGFIMHRLASKEQGYPVYMGCEIDGDANILDKKIKITSEAGTVVLSMNFDSIEIIESDDVCTGFGRLPNEPFVKIFKG